MILAGDALVTAGTPDIIDPDDPWAAYEGRRGGRLVVLSASDGSVKSELKLTSAPTPDGMAAGSGVLLVSTVDGKLICLGRK